MCFKILTLDDLSGCMYIRRFFGISWNQWGEHRRMKWRWTQLVSKMIKNGSHICRVLVFGPVGYTLPRCCFQEVKIEHSFKRFQTAGKSTCSNLWSHAITSNGPLYQCPGAAPSEHAGSPVMAGMAGVNLNHQNYNTFFTRVAGTKIYRNRASKQRRFPVSRLRPGTSVSRIWGGKNAFLRKWP